MKIRLLVTWLKCPMYYQVSSRNLFHQYPSVRKYCCQMIARICISETSSIGLWIVKNVCIFSFLKNVSFAQYASYYYKKCVSENDYQPDFFEEKLVIRKMLLSEKLTLTLHKKWGFPSAISWLNYARSTRNCGFRPATFLDRL